MVSSRLFGMATHDEYPRSSNPNNESNHRDNNNLTPHKQGRVIHELDNDPCLLHKRGTEQHTVGDHRRHLRGDDLLVSSGAQHHPHLAREPGDNKKSIAAGESRRRINLDITHIIEEKTKNIELIKSNSIPTSHLSSQQRSKVLPYDKGQKIGHLRGQLPFRSENYDKGTFS